MPGIVNEQMTARRCNGPRACMLSTRPTGPWYSPLFWAAVFWWSLLWLLVLIWTFLLKDLFKSRGYLQWQYRRIISNLFLSRKDRWRFHQSSSDSSINLNYAQIFCINYSSEQLAAQLLFRWVDRKYLTYGKVLMSLTMLCRLNMYIIRYPNNGMPVYNRIIICAVFHPLFDSVLYGGNGWHSG